MERGKQGEEKEEQKVRKEKEEQKVRKEKEEQKVRKEKDGGETRSRRKRKRKRRERKKSLSSFFLLPYLLRRQRDPCHLCIGKRLGQQPRRAPDPAPDVQNPLHGGAAGVSHSRPLEHLFDEVHFGSLEVLAEVTSRPLLLGIVSEVDVLAPVVLEDAVAVSFRRFFVVVVEWSFGRR